MHRTSGAQLAQSSRGAWALRRARCDQYLRADPVTVVSTMRRFTSGDSNAADPEVRVLSDEDLEQAKQEGQQRG